MKLSLEETRFLTALLREQMQSGGTGPAHQLLRDRAYPGVPTSGPRSLAFSYEANPLTTVLLDGMDLAEINEFLQRKEGLTVEWPWSSSQEYRARLEEARKDWAAQREASDHRPANGVSGGSPVDSGHVPVGGTP